MRAGRAGFAQLMLQVFDIWESQQDFDTFGATLMPVLQQVGLDTGQPVVEPVHSVIPG